MSFLLPRRNLFLAASLGLLVGVVVWASGISRKQQTSQQIDVRVQNKTASLKIVSTTKVGKGDVADLEVVLMNQSQKTVLAYTFSSGESSLTSFGLNLAPGESNTEWIPITNLAPSAQDKSVSYLRLSAVYLEDGSSEGESIDVSRLKNRMLGIREQTSSALQALRKASSTGESDPERLSKMIEDNLSAMSIAEDNSEIASERLAGRAFIKERISRETNEISANKDASGRRAQERLQALILSLEKISGLPHLEKQEDK